MPEVDASHRFFPACGTDKKEVLKDGITADDYLLDDYTLNLNAWEPPGGGIKLLNGINHTRGTWQKSMVACAQTPEALAADIAAVVRQDGNDRKRVETSRFSKSNRRRK